MNRRSFPTGKRGFSLTEILVVLAIMSVLSALMATSFSSLRFSSLSLAGNNMVDVCAMARQNSIAKNDFTAVLIMTQGANACSAYSLWEMPRQADGSFGAWTQLSPWRLLPNGVVFENTSSDTFMQTTSSLPTPLPSTVPYKGTQVSTTSGMVTQCFQSDGTLAGGQLSNGAALRLRLIGGVADGNGNTTSRNAADYYDLYFVANTGMTKIGRP